MDNMQEFMYCLGKLEPVEFIGVAEVLGVKMTGDQDSKDEMRPFNEILEDMLRAFKSNNRKRRRELMRILRSATKGRDYYKRSASESKGSVAEQENSRGESEEE